MITPKMSRLFKAGAGAGARVGAAVALVAGLAPLHGGAVGAAAQAAPAVAETPAGVCAVEGGSFTWGVKESFRAYISGSIANGEWQVSDGLAYEVPHFVWSGATGEIDPATGAGSVSFGGTVHFTGHDGVLDLTLANPTIEFEEDGTVALLLDTKSNDAEGNLAVDETQEWVAEGEIPGGPDVSGGAFKVSDAPLELTNSGAAAFAGFYEAGIELDPMSFELELPGCGSTPAAATGQSSDQGAADTQSPQPADMAEVETGQRVPWLPITIGGVALLVIGFTAGLLLGGRRLVRTKSRRH